MKSESAFDKSRSGKWVRTILSRTLGITWNTIPETRTPEGYVQIEVWNGRNKHRKYWVHEPDIGRTDRVKLYERSEKGGVI